ncbi:MAG: ABC transporter permease [Oscillospiraceae bacterium]|nr:ABC transporter permease [Oscillospiraceae bacterium]
MFFLENIRLAFGSLMTNKMRSLLTMLGIIIGISSVITITTIGNSLQKTLSNTFSMFGGNSYTVEYEFKDYDEEQFSIDEFYVINDSDYITSDMLDEMNERFGGKYIISMRNSLGRGTIRNRKGQDLNAVLWGGTEGYYKLNEKTCKLLKGRYLNDTDSERSKNAIMVSDIFVEQYFKADEDPIGKTISVNLYSGFNVDFVIVGIFEPSKEMLKMLDQDKSNLDKRTFMFVPYHTVDRLNGVPQREFVSYPEFISTEGTNDIEGDLKELQSFFDEMYASNKRLYPKISSSLDMMEKANKILNLVTVAISVIAAISLLVGGIGVMNIMLVSITERTREIGVRKAIGAKSSVIRTQFIIEAVILSLIGGFIGVVLGIGGGILIGYAAKNFILTSVSYADLVEISIQPSLAAILISLGFCMLIGIFFGSYPASKAAKLDPIEALRYE